MRGRRACGLQHGCSPGGRDSPFSCVGSNFRDSLLEERVLKRRDDREEEEEDLARWYRGWLNFLEPNYCKVFLDFSFRLKARSPPGRAPTQHDSSLLCVGHHCCTRNISLIAASHTELTTTIDHRAAQQPLTLCSDIELIKCIASVPKCCISFKLVFHELSSRR